MDLDILNIISRMNLKKTQSHTLMIVFSTARYFIIVIVKKKESNV